MRTPAQAVALKLHGVDVDIQVIKRKGEPLCVDQASGESTPAAPSTNTPSDTAQTTASAIPASCTSHDQHPHLSNSADTTATALSSGRSSSTSRPHVLNQCSISRADADASAESNSWGKCFKLHNERCSALRIVRSQQEYNSYKI